MSASGPGRAGKPTFSNSNGGPLSPIDFTSLPDLLLRLELELDKLELDLDLELVTILDAASCGIVGLVLDLDELLSLLLLLLNLELF